jgi:hypothetical protein
LVSWLLYCFFEEFSIHAPLDGISQIKSYQLRREIAPPAFLPLSFVPDNLRTKSSFYTRRYFLGGCCAGALGFGAFAGVGDCAACILVMGIPQQIGAAFE